jgi:hypothetical protein
MPVVLSARGVPLSFRGLVHKPRTCGKQRDVGRISIGDGPGRERTQENSIDYVHPKGAAVDSGSSHSNPPAVNCIPAPRISGEAVNWIRQGPSPDILDHVPGFNFCTLIRRVARRYGTMANGKSHCNSR